MKTLFKEPEITAEYARNGYVILDMFHPDEVEQEKRFFYKHVHNYNNEPLYESSRNNSDETNNLINSHLQKIFMEKAEAYFQNARIYGGTYMVKPSRSKDYLPLHQDWSIVEEDQYQTAFIWFPLQYTSPKNGGLFVVPGSHLFYHNRRSGSLPCPRITVDGLIKFHLKKLRVKPGQVVIYSDQLFHGSYTNPGDSPRITATARLVEQDARLTYYHRISADKIGVFYFDKHTYLNGIRQLVGGKIPEGLSPAYLEDYQNEEINSTTFAQKIKNHLPQKSIVRKLISRFS